jgi:arabinan endo-1,5-alpha-L-arabinosidase
MSNGGGTLLVEGDSRWRGPGHNAVIFRGTSAYNFYHSYDANSNGRVTLRISELVWDQDGWPISGGP